MRWRRPRTRLKFVTTVYIPGMRDPYSAAKAIGTAAYLADGRVELGVGVGWCEEEFALMGQQFARRGKRTDEMLELMQELWQPGWREFNGDFYQMPRLEMSLRRRASRSTSVVCRTSHCGARRATTVGSVTSSASTRPSSGPTSYVSCVPKRV